MKKTLTIITALILGATAQASTLRIDLVVLNDSQTATQAVDAINFDNPDHVARLQAAVDAMQGQEGSSLTRLKRQLVARIRELVRNYEQEQVRETYIQQMIEAEAEVEDLPIE